MDYRDHLRAAVALSAAPYGYTLTLWTAGAVASHAGGLPSPVDALLLLAGAVSGFAIVGSIAFGGINRVLAPGTGGDVRVWGGAHLPSVGSSILLVWLLTDELEGHVLWPAVGFAATSTYLLVIGVQFWLSAHLGGVPDPRGRRDVSE